MKNKEIKHQIREIILKGHIRPRSSLWENPIILVQKKERTWNFFIDYRSLNKITVNNQYPIPQIDDLLYHIKESKFFSKIDLNSGYHQVPIEKTNVWNTTFKSK
jgi:putative transposase